MQDSSKDIRRGVSRGWCRTLSVLNRAFRFQARLVKVLRTNHKKRTGRWGERQARRYLQRAGLRHLQSNWCWGKYEADLILLDRRILTVVEVKTRHERLMRLFPAIRAVTSDKRRTLRSLAQAFMRSHGPLCRRRGIRASRTDAIEVYYAYSLIGIRRVTSISWYRGSLE